MWIGSNARMECCVQLKSTLTDRLTSDAVSLQSCYWQTLKQQCKPFVSYSFLNVVHKINMARHLCAGDGFSNKYGPGTGKHNSCCLQPVLCWITLGMGLILSVSLLMSALARTLSTASRELAAPALSMWSTDMKKKQEAEGKYCSCFTGLKMYTD